MRNWSTEPSGRASGEQSRQYFQVAQRAILTVNNDITFIGVFIRVALRTFSN